MFCGKGSSGVGKGMRDMITTNSDIPWFYLCENCNCEIGKMDLVATLSMIKKEEAALEVLQTQANAYSRRYQMKGLPMTNNDNNNFTEDKHKDCYDNESIPDNASCGVCGGNHNVLVINLENGGHIITEHFFKGGPIKVNFNFDIKRKGTTLGLANPFRPTESSEIQ
jgi:hypothetical protein